MVSAELKRAAKAAGVRLTYTDAGGARKPKTEKRLLNDIKRAKSKASKAKGGKGKGMKGGQIGFRNLVVAARNLKRYVKDKAGFLIHAAESAVDTSIKIITPAISNSIGFSLNLLGYMNGSDTAFRNFPENSNISPDQNTMINMLRYINVMKYTKDELRMTGVLEKYFSNYIVEYRKLYLEFEQSITDRVLFYMSKASGMNLIAQGTSCPTNESVNPCSQYLQYVEKAITHKVIVPESGNDAKSIAKYMNDLGLHNLGRDEKFERIRCQIQNKSDKRSEYYSYNRVRDNSENESNFVNYLQKDFDAKKNTSILEALELLIFFWEPDYDSDGSSGPV